MAEQYEKPLTGNEYAALQTLFAVVSTWQEVCDNGALEKRLRGAGGTLWRDVRLIQTLSEKSMRALLKTVPLKKLKHIQAELSMTHLYIKVVPPGMTGMSSKGYSYTPTKALNALLNYLCEHECGLCDKTEVESRKCEWRHVLEEALPHEVGKDRSGNCRYSDLVLGLGGDEE